MGLLDLPSELLLSLPGYISNIEDFTNTASSCRTLRTLFAQTHPNRILQLAAASSRVFFRPDPWFLVAATARQVSEWGLESEENTQALRFAFRGGIEFLLELCVSVAGLTMDDIRRMHASRFEIINPVSDMIDRMAGKQWYATPNFWNGGVSEAYTIECEPMRALFQLAIYGELFESTLQAWLEPEAQQPKHSIHTRLDYVRYCILDWGATTPSRSGVLMPVERVRGPYAGEDAYGTTSGDGVAMNYVLRCGRWERPWEAIRRQIGPDFEEDWRQEIWNQAVQTQGLAGLELLRPGGVEKWRAKLEKIRTNVARIPNQPPKALVSDNNVIYSELPNLRDEAYIYFRSYWGG